MPTV
ncbi:ca60fc4a-1cd0-4a5a-be9a-6e03265d6441 [Thermothielavioides terrestris]|jgi:hypothetical protein